MTTNDTKTRTIPTPLYAAAGAGELAYQKLRELPAKVAELRTRAGGPDLDVDHLRTVARRNAAAFVAGAQAAQEKAVAIYNDLVARGEQVVRGSAKATEDTAKEIAATVEVDAKPAPVKAAKATKAAKSTGTAK
jgi:heparin binding hemagglutinin HbhA